MREVSAGPIINQFKTGIRQNNNRRAQSAKFPPPRALRLVDVMGFMERVTPIVDDTIRALAKVEFIPDPIAGTYYSRTTSIVSSAYKRHGKILEFALRESLRESNRHKVWNDEAFKVSREADGLASTQDFEACRHSTIGYRSPMEFEMQAGLA